MKSKSYVITYLSALVIGILLLIYHQQQSLYQTIVIAIGALIAVPSLVLLLTMLLRKRPVTPPSATVKAVTIASEVAAAAGLAFGIWMMCSPQFFITAIIYTLGAILILVGIAQITYVYQAARPFRPAIGWFIVPFLTLLAGVIIIVMGPAKVSSCAGLITGIVLVVYAANGFASAGREAKLQHDMQNMEEEKLREEAADRKREKQIEAKEITSKADETKAGEPAETDK